MFSMQKLIKRFMKRRRPISKISFCSIIFLWITLFTSVLYYVNQWKVLPCSSHYDKDTLVDLDGFKFVMNNVSLCMESEIEGQSYIVIMVHSARSNFKERYAIRNTWGSVKLFNEWHFHLIFLLGTGNEKDPEKLEHQLWEESKLNGDMIMGNFVESYQNLSYKHLMGYKWVSTYCPTAKFILKTDDNVFTDIFQVVEILLANLNNSKFTFACLNMIGNQPQREIANKWYISEQTFPGDMYPEFCSGAAYLMKADAAAKIYAVSNKTPFIWIDNVFVTGVLREKYDFLATNSTNSSLNIMSLQNIYNFKLDLKTPDMTRWCKTGLESNQLAYTYIIFEDRGDIIRDMFCMWNKIRLTRFAMNSVIDSYFTATES